MTVQQILVKNNWFRLAVSVTLTLAVLVVFVFAPFNTAHAIVGVDDAIIVVLIAGLASIGITFASTGAFNTLNEYVGSLLEEYAADNNTTVFGVTNGVNASANAAGKLLLNNRFILLIDTFARWLKAKFNLADNTDISVVEAGTVISDITLYNVPLNTVYQVNGNWFVVYSATAASVYLAFYRSSESAPLTPYFFSEEPFTATSTLGYSQNPNVSQTSKQALFVSENAIYNYVVDSGLQGTPYNLNTDIQYSTYQHINDVLANNIPADESNVGIDVDVGTMNLPLDNPDYTTGDGGILDVGATWGRPYTGVVNGEIPTVWPQVVAGTVNPAITYEPEGVIEDQLPAPSDVENLPSGSWFGLPSGFEGLRLSSIWHYVVQWINDTATAGGLLWNTASAMPSPVVNMVFAMVVVAIVFGVLKTLRAH